MGTGEGSYPTKIFSSMEEVSFHIMEAQVQYGALMSIVSTTLFVLSKLHWISMCVNLVNRTVEVFDCRGKKNTKVVEAFAVLIP
ncbi:hypothetical protein Bca52824_010192 [Brassica carinata]|uniref:Ubiquitin-like protease family profile domain-containing protein n=1 Tax=Brassica carinata TaxID=52824 RepID=A0A8X7WBB2_BRACI|nr:hypothetical protein Bca52824_010192 [Brassica carinata]